MPARILTPVEEVRLARRIERGDAAARDEMVARNLPLVRSLAARYIGRGVPFEDLVQEGSVGLVLAVEGERVRLRALATGRVWDAPLPAVRQVSAREELSMRLAAANARAGSRI